MDTGLEGEGVLVTGASGAIGGACAEAFAAEGSHLVLHYHQGRDRAEALARQLPSAHVAQADLTKEHEVERLFARARSLLGHIDICVAVAGMSRGTDTPIRELTLERWSAVIAGNLTSTFLTSREFLREVSRNGHGNLVLVGSTAGRFGQAGNADYAAAKSAIMYGLLLSLKNEIVQCAPNGRVNAVCPGWTDTPMTHDRIVNAAFVQSITRTMPLKKVAQPRDVASQVISLASDVVSGHVTGECITIAGGMEGRIVHS